MTMVQCFWDSPEDYHKDTGIVRQLPETTNFTVTPMKKIYLAVYYILGGDTSPVSIFFPDIDKNE